MKLFFIFFCINLCISFSCADYAIASYSNDWEKEDKRKDMIEKLEYNERENERIKKYINNVKDKGNDSSSIGVFLFLGIIIISTIVFVKNRTTSGTTKTSLGFEEYVPSSSSGGELLSSRRKEGSKISMYDDRYITCKKCGSTHLSQYNHKCVNNEVV